MQGLNAEQASPLCAFVTQTLCMHTSVGPHSPRSTTVTLPKGPASVPFPQLVPSARTVLAPRRAMEGKKTVENFMAAGCRELIGIGG